jgi:DNA invertase Pin-like site-specific DNA recombinase
MLKDAVRARFDVIMAWDVSRMGRSLTGLVETLDELHANRVDLYLHQQAIDTTTPSGKAMFQLCGVFAEFARAIISERVKSGLNSVRSEGQRLGRPPVVVDKDSVFRSRTEGMSIRRIAAQYHLSIGTVYNILNFK